MHRMTRAGVSMTTEAVRRGCDPRSKTCAWGWLARVVMVIAAALITAACTIDGFGRSDFSEPLDNVTIGSFALSPDGETIAFTGGDGKQGVLGLYRWRTEELDLLPLPWDKYGFLGPNFSPDGDSLAVVMKSKSDKLIDDIGLIDLRTRQARLITHEPAGSRTTRHSPVVTPDGRGIAFVEGGYGEPKYLRRVEIDTGVISDVIPQKRGFIVGILSICYLSADRLIFQAIGPADNKTLKELRGRLGQTMTFPTAFTASYTVNEENPELIFPNAQRALVESAPFNFTPLAYLASPGDGQNMYFAGLSVPHDSVDWRYDIFKLTSDSGIRRISKLQIFIIGLTVNRGNTHVAFGEVSLAGGKAVYKQRIARLLYDISIFDLRSGQYTPLALRPKLAARLSAQHPDKP